MRFLVCLLVLCFSMLLNQAFAFDLQGSGANSCSDCHKLDVKEAEGLLKGSVEKIHRVDFAEMPGVWLVEVENKGERFPLYVDFSKKFVVAGNIYRLPGQPADQGGQDKRVDISRIPLDDALLLGSPMAEHRVIVFTDPLCPYCERLHKELEKVVARDANIAFLIKLYPLDMHGREAFDISRAAVCNQSLQVLEGGFKLIGLHGQLRQLQKQPAADPRQVAQLQQEFDARVRELTVNVCPTPAVDATKALAKQLGLTGTPAMVFSDGSVVSGVRKAEDLITMIRAAATSAKDGK